MWFAAGRGVAAGIEDYPEGSKVSGIPLKEVKTRVHILSLNGRMDWNEDHDFLGERGIRILESEGECIAKRTGVKFVVLGKLQFVVLRNQNIALGTKS